MKQYLTPEMFSIKLHVFFMVFTTNSKSLLKISYGSIIVTSVVIGDLFNELISFKAEITSAVSAIG
jgi:hypothetical protein